MKDEFYTSDGQHPDDAIYQKKQFIKELIKVQDSYFSKLVIDLKLNQEGEDFLFDYIYNSDEDEDGMEFEEFLEIYGKKYEDIVKRDFLFRSLNSKADLDTDFPTANENIINYNPLDKLNSEYGK